MEYVLIIGIDMNYEKYNFDNKFVIGIDRGAYTALKAGVKLDLAVGDFDSIDKEMLDFIESKTKVDKLSCKKNYTDTQEALKYCKDASKITILGGIQGKRIEHFIANIILMVNNPKIEMLDNNSHIFTVDSSFSLKRSNYQFISFFALSDTFITLEGFAYPLNNYYLKNTDPLTVSNEIVAERGIITLKGGRLLVIQSNKDLT